MSNNNKKGFGWHSNDAAILNPPQHNRQTKRKRWTNYQTQETIDDIMESCLNANAAAKKHGVPPSTLKDGLTGRVVLKPGPKPYLSATEEKELTSHLIDAADIGYGKTRAEV